uniref:Conserved oligomeric Golgi complex subunit 1 n=1 Tax=Picocystis salinarum TaxID=88271 RepID=A0A7S3UFN4_9CHLO
MAHVDARRRAWTVEADARRSAESLFETRNVKEIRTIAERTEQDVERKQGELRQLIGSSYRDFIQSADTVVSMAETCMALVEDVGRIKISFRNLSEDVAAFVAKSPKSNAGLGDRDKLYAVGTRVKFLMDTPEIIWGCMDESDHLEASRRYVRAEQVNRLITRGKWKDALSNFPLLRHQWPAIEKFKSQIAEKARTNLCQDRLSLQQASNALSAVASLEGIDAEQVLQVFLRMKLFWLEKHLQGIRENKICNMKDLEGKVREIVQSIQNGMYQAGHLFLVSTEQKQSKLLEYVVATGVDGMAFADITHNEDEIMLWQESQTTLEDKLSLINNDKVTQCCLDWLQGVSQALTKDAAELFGALDSLKDLEALQSAIHDEISRIGSNVDVERWLTTLQGAPVEDIWEATCEAVIRKPLDVWGTFFEHIFVEKAKGLICAAYEALSLETQVSAVLEEITNGTPCPPGSIGSQKWPLEEPEARALESTQSVSSAAEHTVASSWRNQLPSLVHQMDVGLFRNLEDIVRFLNSDSKMVTSRKAEIEPFAKTQCKHAMVDLEKLVLGTVERLESSNNSTTEATVIAVEQRLFLARLSSDIASGSKSLQLTLGSSEKWNNVVSLTSFANGIRRLGSLGAGSAQQKGLAGARELIEVQEFLQKASFRASRAWIDWSASALVAKLSDQLLNSASYRTALGLKWWEELEVENDGYEPLRIKLPTMPSSCIVCCCFEACCELHRAGAHFLDMDTLRYFEWTLGHKVLDLVESLLLDDSPFSQALTEKGAIQLLLDLKFLEDVLAGCSDGVETGADLMAAYLQWKRRVSAVLGKVASRIDPIDWATYEPYLWQNEEKCYHRSCVLLGSLTQTRRLHTGPPQKLPYSSDTNILDMGSTAPRFMYLPISAPASILPFQEDGNGAFGTFADDLLEEDGFSWGRTFMGQVQRGSGLFNHADKVQERAAQAMASLGEYLPPAGGLLSSFTQGVSKR